MLKHIKFLKKLAEFSKIKSFEPSQFTVKDSLTGNTAWRWELIVALARQHFLTNLFNESLKLVIQQVFSEIMSDYEEWKISVCKIQDLFKNWKHCFLKETKIWMINYKENLDVDFLDNEFDFAELLERLNEQFQIHWLSKFFSWNAETVIWKQCSEHAL